MSDDSEHYVPINHNHASDRSAYGYDRGTNGTSNGNGGYSHALHHTATDDDGVTGGQHKTGGTGTGTGDAGGAFTVLGVPLSWTAALVLFCGGTVAGGTGQAVALSLFEASFGGFTGVYFVLFFCGMCFNLFFWPVAFFLIYKGGIPPEQTKWNTKHQLYMAAVGLCDAANGFLVVFSSSLARVPGPMQSILLQAMIPFTLLFSRLVLRKKYSRQQMLGAFVVLIGIAFSLIPLFVRLHNGTESAAVPSGQWYWPLILLLSVVPGALMNVIQERLQHMYLIEAPLSAERRFSVVWFQACESLYQFIFIGAFFWLDLIQGFGTSTSVSVFHDSFDFGFRCFVNTGGAHELSDKCGMSGALGVIFIGSYIITYISGTLMTLYASANLSSVMSAVPPVLATIFWYAFPSINEWGGGQAMTGLDAGFNLGSIPFIALGIWLYRTNELGKEEKAPQPDEGAIELCF